MCIRDRAVEGGDGDADDTATDMAHACGPVHLDPTTEGHVGAHKLSNNTAEGPSGLSRGPDVARTCVKSTAWGIGIDTAR